MNFPPPHASSIKKWHGIREEASACHASQGGGPRSSGYLVTWLLRQINSSETFMRAVPPPVDGHVEKDLFEGID